MCDSSQLKIEIQDIIEELRDENNRISNELKLTENLFNLFENYRQFLNKFLIDCKCNLNIESNSVFNELETKYSEIKANILKVSPVLRTQELLNSNQKQLSDGFKDNTICEIEDSNRIRVKRNRRKDFIKPKPVFKICPQIVDHFYAIQNSRVDEKISAKSEQITGYLCQYPNCNYKNPSKGNVCRHISQMHLNKRPLICGECEQTFWGQKRLFEHKKCSHFPKNIYNINQKLFKCDVNTCHYQTKSISNFTQHKRRHSGEKPFKCVDCLSCFVTNSELKTHRISIHCNYKPFLCEWDGCEQAFKTKDKLNTHLYSHTGLYPFPCCWPGCNAKYTKQVDLKLHQLSHSKDYPYMCEWSGCSSKFKTKNARNIHNYTHTGERPFKCEWPGCESSYYMISKLNRHKLSHNGIKKYLCNWPECDKKYSTSHNLKLHLMAHRNERPYICSHCQRRFTDNSRMKRHSKKIHKTFIC